MQTVTILMSDGTKTSIQAENKYELRTIVDESGALIVRTIDNYRKTLSISCFASGQWLSYIFTAVGG